MRQRAVQVILLAVLVLTLLCGIGSLHVWSGQGLGLVMRGASNVRIEHGGAMQLHITYELPLTGNRHDLRAFLMRQGWRSAGFSNVDRETVMTFMQPGWYGRMRSVLLVTTDHSHRIVDMQFGYCVTLGSWVKCI